MDWWNKLAKMWWEGEKKTFPENPKVEKYYRAKFRVAHMTKADRICEIGVRAGYSAYSFLSARPEAEFVGLDNNGNAHGGVKGLFTDVAPKILSEFKNVDLVLFDSQRNAVLHGAPYDFIHIDGDHSYKGCMHDLEMARECCEWILVDDYDFLRGVRNSVDDFLNAYNFDYQHIRDGFRGNMLIHTTFRRKK